jgi:hypothetical protein
MLRLTPVIVGKPAPLCLIFLFTCLIGTANAQQTPVFHVRYFAMRADRAQVRVGDSFHLTIELRVDETTTHCDAINPPDFYGFDSLGAEQHISTRPAGTTCIEIITLSPIASGEHIIPPATIDAIDGATRTPSRFSTNTVSINALHATLHTATIVRNTVIQMFKALVVLLLALALIRTAYWALARMLPGFAAVRRIPHANNTADAAQPAPIDERERLRTIVEVLAAQPTRRNVLAVRMILRTMVHARDDEVFGELLARVTAGVDPALLEVMRVIERAAFIDDEHLPEAVRDAVRVLKQWAFKQQQALT